MADYMGFERPPKPHNHEASEDDGSNIIFPAVVNGRVKAGHPAFSTVFDAVEFAYNNGYGHVDVPPGTYGPLQIVYPVHVHGTAPAHPYSSSPRVIFDGGDDDGVLITADGATVSNVMALTDENASDPYSAFAAAADHTAFLNCYAFQADFAAFSTDVVGISGGANWVQFRNCGAWTPNIGYTDEVVIHSDSTDCTVDVDPDLTVSNNGTNTKIV